MLALKQKIELDFQDHWADTPLHIFGFDFDSVGVDNWIMLKVIPSSNNIDDVTNTCHTEEVFMEVTCYGTTLHQAIDTSDAVEQFIRNNTVYDVRTSTSYEQNNLEGKYWYQTVRINAYNRNGIVPLAYLVDGNLDFLVDANLDRLIT